MNEYMLKENLNLLQVLQTFFIELRSGRTFHDNYYFRTTSYNHTSQINTPCGAASRHHTVDLKQL